MTTIDAGGRERLYGRGADPHADRGTHGVIWDREAEFRRNSVEYGRSSSRPKALQARTVRSARIAAQLIEATPKNGRREHRLPMRGGVEVRVEHLSRRA